MKETIKCYACNRETNETNARPFGWRAGQVATWICNDCRNSSVAPVDTLDGGPRLAWSTIAKAERLRAAGYGWTVNDVLQRGLLTLEHTAAGRK